MRLFFTKIWEVLLYYDPTEKTEQKKEIARRDSILFGLINHSNKLYYIADWTDDLCDLTLDEVATKLGSGSIKEIKEEIDTGTVLA